MTESHEVAVVGGGQAGLSLGYHLRRDAEFIADHIAERQTAAAG